MLGHSPWPKTTDDRALLTFSRQEVILPIILDWTSRIFFFQWVKSILVHFLPLFPLYSILSLAEQRSPFFYLRVQWIFEDSNYFLRGMYLYLPKHFQFSKFLRVWFQFSSLLQLLYFLCSPLCLVWGPDQNNTPSHHICFPFFNPWSSSLHMF